jgi:hypothetical protein
MKNCTTQLPIIEFITSNIECDRAFEFGMNLFTTNLLSDRFKNVISVESDQNWYDEMKKEQLPDHVDLQISLEKKSAIDILNSVNGKLSCVIVDGNEDNRWECVNASFEKTDVIIAHDTETHSYKWNLIEKPKDFLWIDIKQYNPWTSVLTTNKDLILAIVQKYPSHTVNHV